MRAALVLVLLAACAGNGGGGNMGMVRVTAYGRCASQSTPPGVLAAGVEIDSYTDPGTTPFATATTDANGVAMLSVPAGGSIAYRPCSHVYEVIEAVEPDDDLIVGDPTPVPAACSTGTGSMTVVFPTVANATSYTVNGVTSTSATVVISGCNGAQVSVLGEAYDSANELVGYQFQTVEFVDQSTLQLDSLLAPSILDLTVNPPPSASPWLGELDAVFGSTQGAGTYRFVYPKIAPTCTVGWNALRGAYAEPAADVTISTDQTSLAVDVPQLTQSPSVATRFIGEVTNAAPTGDLEVYATYLVDAPPGSQLSLQSLPIDVPTPSAQDMPVNAFRAYAILDNQYDDYADFRNQRRHLDRDVHRSVLNTGGQGMLFTSGYYGTWPTSR